MSEERAQEILNQKFQWGNITIAQGVASDWKMTSDERTGVMMKWRTMPGNTSFTDALRRISKGE